MTAKTLRVLVADDEALARQRLEDLLAAREEVGAVCFAKDGPAAVQAVQAEQPDLVFLDVQMPGLTGPEVVRAVGPEDMPAVIFVTAYDEYAIEAFELAALDYLVKPFEDARFEEALRRAGRQIRLRQKGQFTDRLLTLLDAEETPPAERSSAETPAPEYLERIAVETPGRLRVVAVGDIDYIRADGSYAELHVGERTYAIRARMKTLEQRLDPSAFFRIHRSVIVQLDRIASLLHSGGGDYAAQLGDGTHLPVSRSRREELEERLGMAL